MANRKIKPIRTEKDYEDHPTPMAVINLATALGVHPAIVEG